VFGGTAGNAGRPGGVASRRPPNSTLVCFVSS